MPAPRPPWLVTSPECDPGAVERLLRLLPEWFGIESATLGAHPDPGYELTRRFYAGVGFRPLEEIHGLWPESPCLIMIKSLS